MSGAELKRVDARAPDAVPRLGAARRRLVPGLGGFLVQDGSQVQVFFGATCRTSSASTTWQMYFLIAAPPPRSVFSRGKGSYGQHQDPKSG